MQDLWDKLVVGLDDDERVVFPQMYRDNTSLYDKIVGIAYLVRAKDYPDDGLDWVWEGSLGKVNERLELDVLGKVYIVRLRLPWNSVRHEWLCNQQELDDHREEVEVLGVYLRVRRKDNPTIIPIIDPLEFESNRDKYEVIEARYLVAWKSDPEQEERFLDIPGDRFHTVISE